MERIIKAVTEKELESSLDFVEKVFTDSEGEKEGKLVRSLLAEIRSKREQGSLDTGCVWLRVIREITAREDLSPPQITAYMPTKALACHTLTVL